MPTQSETLRVATTLVETPTEDIITANGHPKTHWWKTSGFTGKRHTEESKKKISDRHKELGIAPPNPTGRKVSEESVNKTQSKLAYNTKVIEVRKSFGYNKWKKFKEELNIIEGTNKFCTGCSQVKDLINFNSPKQWCNVCLSSVKEKTCTKCTETFTKDKFTKNKQTRDGLSSKCSKCTYSYVKSKGPRKTNKEINRKKTAWKYGITIEQFDLMIEEQKGVCKICRNPPGAKRDCLVIDHDHTTGEVRGLLCDLCNTALGGFKDSVDNLLSACNYLIECMPTEETKNE